MIGATLTEKRTAVFIVTTRGEGAARKLQCCLDNVVVHGPGLKGAALKRKVAAEFAASDALVFIAATGVAVRMIAPLVVSKATDPAVVVVDERAAFAVSLISGHMGGANRLAKRIAKLLGATPVITTATDGAGLPCIEYVAERFALKIDGTAKIKIINSAILDSARVFIIVEDAGLRRSLKKAYGRGGVFTVRKSFPASVRTNDAFVHVTPFVVKYPKGLLKRTLFLRPREFALGMGFGKCVRAAKLEAAFAKVLVLERISPLSITTLATIDIKTGDAELDKFLRGQPFGCRAFSAKELNTVKAPSKSCSAVEINTGAVAVSEPAAMLAAGVKKIWAKKRKIGHVTVALARQRVLYTS